MQNVQNQNMDKNEIDTKKENNIFGEVIYAYTREQAIDDGVLVDITSIAQEAGFKLPVAITREAWDRCVAWTDEDNEKQAYQDESGRLWDVLFMAFMGITTRNRRRDALYVNANSVVEQSTDDQTLIYSFFYIPCDGYSNEAIETHLKIIVHGGDQGEPVITIMEPHQD